MAEAAAGCAVGSVGPATIDELNDLGEGQMDRGC